MLESSELTEYRHAHASSRHVLVTVLPICLTSHVPNDLHVSIASTLQTIKCVLLARIQSKRIVAPTSYLKFSIQASISNIEHYISDFKAPTIGSGARTRA